MKHSKQELQIMARESLRAKQNRDHRIFQLIMSISMIAGMTASEVEQCIEELAK